jgi:hypothetical protein
MGCPFCALLNDYLVNRAVMRFRRDKMKYLCMAIVDEKKLAAMPEAAAQALTDESLAYDKSLKDRGHYITAQALESVNAATMVRIRNGKVTVTDGPFAETNEQIGGFILIEAKDLNEAIQVASKIPAIQLGGIEVRPIKELVASTK